MFPLHRLCGCSRLSPESGGCFLRVVRPLAARLSWPGLDALPIRASFCLLSANLERLFQGRWRIFNVCLGDLVHDRAGRPVSQPSGQRIERLCRAGSGELDVAVGAVGNPARQIQASCLGLCRRAVSAVLGDPHSVQVGKMQWGIFSHSGVSRRRRHFFAV